MSTLTISMPEALKGFVDEQVRILGYDDVSEYLGALVREALEKDANRRLESLLLEGLDSGEDIEATGAFWDGLHTDVAQRIAERRRK